MARELKKYGLRATRKPPTRQAKLASTVHVLDERGVACWCYVSFEEPLLVKVGTALPRGISERNPAFLRVEYSATLKQWIIAAQYLDESHTAILWQTPDRPAWLNHHFYRGNPST